MTPELYDYTGFYLIVLTKSQSDFLQNIQKIFRDLFSLYITNTILIISSTENLKEISLYNFFPFQKYGCGRVKPILWNKFKDGKYSLNRSFFPNKLRNMYGCPIRVVTFETPPYMILEKRPNNSLEILGIEGILLRVLSNRMNFTIELSQPSDGQKWGVTDIDGPLSGAIKIINDGLANMTLGCFGLTFNRIKYMSMSFPYFQTPLLFIVPPGRPYSSIEKFLQPMDQWIWYCLGAELFIGGFVIVLLKYTKRQIRHFIMGRNNRIPFFNMFAIFSGNSSTYLPNRNFSRTILMIWILSSLIIRAAYQDSLFHFMQKQTSVNNHYTLSSLIKENFTFHVPESSLKYFDDLKEIKKRIKIMKPTDVADRILKKVTLSTGGHIAYKNKLYKQALLTTDDYIFVLSLAIFVRKSSYLLHTMNNEIQLYLANGLMDRWVTEYIQEKYVGNTFSIKEPKKLTNAELLGGYEICAVFYIYSIFVAILEILSKKFKFIRGLMNLFHSIDM